MAYILKSLPADRVAYGGFQWPESGYVEAPDWNPEPECGGGLHGFLNGEGDAALACLNNDAVWKVLETDENAIVDLGRKVKFRNCNILHSGPRAEIIRKMQELCPSSAVMFSVQEGCDDSTQTAGDGSTQTAGDDSTQKAGDESTQTAGDWSTIEGGENCTVTLFGGGKVKHGEGSVIIVRDDGKFSLYVVGKDIDAGQWYTVSVKGASKDD